MRDLSVENERKSETYINLETIGTKVSRFYDRTIEQCLNCKLPECNGCRKQKSEVDK